MISFNDVERVVIETKCHNSCSHSNYVTLKTGMTGVIPSHLIYALISHIGKDRINPDFQWKGDEVIRHFKGAEEWTESAAKAILNSLFEKQTIY